MTTYTVSSNGVVLGRLEPGVGYIPFVEPWGWIEPRVIAMGMGIVSDPPKPLQSVP